MLHFWLVLFVLLMTLVFWKWTRPRNFPPGPWALPIIGNFLQIDYRNPLPDLEKMCKKFGNVYSIYLGVHAVVIVRGYKAVKEALIGHNAELLDRPFDPIFYAISKNRGFSLARYGKSWKEKRRFGLRMLKNLGMGKISMESTILEESKYLLKSFEDMGGQNFEPKSLLRNAVSNIICRILFGHRFDYNDGTFTKIVDHVGKFSKLIGAFWGEVYNGIPIIRWLPLPHRYIFKTISLINDFMRQIIIEHKNTRKVGEPRDFIDHYTEEIEKRKNENDDSYFDEESLFSVVTELFLAGSDTTANTLEWALLFMMTYPDIQARCYEEIKLTLNGTEELKYEDRHRMPYTLAVIYEVFRFGIVAPLSVPRGTLKNMLFHGYTIPKGTKVLLDLNSVHRDESQWKFPHEFNPHNFLNANEEFVKPDAFMAFSAGSRVCIGEILAHMEIFFFFTSLLKHYEFFWPEKHTKPDLTPSFGITQAPFPFKIGIRHRQV
ncbi:cytochrome P450 2F2-like [Protopterus annectens]|uniref:cytochrome P450 2F2-like n=1 Tax=Protopterus annectens TaxID=7888 RepID=UPI001CFC2112|nr:cytochrome P450 2F2-like [Protopterus annectens]